MSPGDDPFDADIAIQRGGCQGGAHKSQAEHDAAGRAAAPQGDDLARRPVANAVMRALFPNDDVH